MHSISFHLSRITYVFLGIIAGVFMGTTIRFVYASWSAPTDTPPDGNVDAPLNVSDTGQTKTGGLNLGSLIVQGSAKINQRIQIGDISMNDPVVYAACDGTIQGTMRFNDANDTMEYCDGEGWKPAFGGGSGGGGFDISKISCGPVSHPGGKTADAVCHDRGGFCTGVRYFSSLGEWVPRDCNYTDASTLGRAGQIDCCIIQ